MMILVLVLVLVFAVCCLAMGVGILMNAVANAIEDGVVATAAGLLMGLAVTLGSVFLAVWSLTTM